MEQEKGHPAEPTSMENWEEALEESIAESTPRRGELREGKIIGITQDGGLLIDIGAKRDGYVPHEDLEEIEDLKFEVGQDVKVLINKFNNGDGNVQLSISQALLQEDWIRAEEMLQEETVYETTVVGSNRGGLIVEFGRLRGFIPMSQLIGFSRIRQPGERYRRLENKAGKAIMLKVIEVNRRRRRLILSELAAAKEWRAARRTKLLAELEPNTIRRGRISQITEFGLFVNLGGLDGLVHVSELSWGRIDDPNEVYRTGQRIKVKVLSVDRDRQRIALSVKALTPDPWETVPERYEANQLVEGKITQIVDFGIFIELEAGVEGLLHNSELGDFEQREELEANQDILVKIIRIEPDRRRIGLSVRQVRREEWEAWATRQLVEQEEKLKVEEEELDDEDELDFEEELIDDVIIEQVESVEIEAAEDLTEAPDAEADDNQDDGAKVTSEEIVAVEPEEDLADETVAEDTPIAEADDNQDDGAKVTSEEVVEVEPEEDLADETVAEDTPIAEADASQDDGAEITSEEIVEADEEHSAVKEAVIETEPEA